MSAYFFVEDSASLCRVLPEWIAACCPGWEEASTLQELRDNTYLVESGFGYPHMKDNLVATLHQFDAANIRPDLIIILFDADDVAPAELSLRCKQFEEKFQQSEHPYAHCILPLRQCFETWLLGNRAAYPKDIPQAFQSDAAFYDVSCQDPEEMKRPASFSGSVPMYHYRYLQKMLRASYHKNYSKGSPMFVSTPAYFLELKRRAEQTTHLHTFREFLQTLKQFQAQRKPADT